MNAQPNNIVDLQIPAPSEVAVTDAQRMLTAAKAFHITGTESAVEMQQTRQRIRTRINELTAERVSMTKPIDESKARIMAFFKRPLEFLEDALKHCDGEIVAHNKRVEEERREQQRQADLAAERERQRLAAIANETRQKAEAEQRQRDLVARQAREAAEAKQRRIREAAEAEARERQRIADAAAEAARAAGDAEAAKIAEQQRQQADLDAAESRRNAELESQQVAERHAEEQRERDRQTEAARLTAESKVENFQSRAATTVAAVAAPEVARVAGVSMRDNWVYEIIDQTQINPDYMTPDTTKIGKLVKALHKEAGPLIGNGVKIENRQVVASKRAGA